MKNILKNIFYLFLPLIIGGIVGFIISGSIDYTNLNQPPLAPPKILFPIVWTIIYLLLGLSYFLYQRSKTKENTLLSMIYCTQLFVNAMWSILFFVWKWRFFSIIWILLLDILVIFLIFLFSKEKRISAYLNIPYLLWILFATYLTIGIYILN